MTHQIIYIHNISLSIEFLAKERAIALGVRLKIQSLTDSVIGSPIEPRHVKGHTPQSAKSFNQINQRFRQPPTCMVSLAEPRHVKGHTTTPIYIYTHSTISEIIQSNKSAVQTAPNVLW